jgi:hypothetical protein
MGIGIEVDAAGIGILASCISVRYRSIPVPNWISLFRYRTGSGIGIFVHSGTGLTGCRTVRHLKKGYTRHVHTAGCGNGYTLQVLRQLLMVFFLLCDIEKSYVNAGLPEKS